MAGRTGTYDADAETWSDVIYMPCTLENHFTPELPKETPDLIYLCYPNNPTGAAITKPCLLYTSAPGGFLPILEIAGAG